MKEHHSSLLLTAIGKIRQQEKRKKQLSIITLYFFGRQAETAAQYLKKDNKRLLKAACRLLGDDTATGTKKYRTEIIADTIQFGAKGNEGGSSSAPSAASHSDASAPVDMIEYPEDDINPEDIPF